MIDRQEFQRINAIIWNAQNQGDGLSAKTQEFIDDMADRLIKYNREILISEAQMAWLNKIEEQLREDLADRYEDDPS